MAALAHGDNDIQFWRGIYYFEKLVGYIIVLCFNNDFDNFLIHEGSRFCFEKIIVENFRKQSFVKSSCHLILIGTVRHK
ncbi:MAG TPA: hypothetical protein DEP42_05355 [Ruminococcaceae bacterium]|nr:hypothetical protein [Oscillospiraceae bacterium]